MSLRLSCNDKSSSHASAAACKSDEKVDLVALDHAGDIAGAACIDGHVAVTLHTVAQGSEHSTDTTFRLNNNSPTKSVEITSANFGRIACALRL